MLKLILILFIFLSVEISRGQEDGSFWWKNKALVKTGSSARSLKDQTAKIRTLPPRYRDRHEDESPTKNKTISIFDPDSQEEISHYKYDNEPDCFCVRVDQCNRNKTDGNGLINERLILFSNFVLILFIYSNNSNNISTFSLKILKLCQDRSRNFFETFQVYFSHINNAVILTL